MYDSIYDFILSTKYVSIFVLMVFFPNETVMPLVGYMAADGLIHPVWAVLVGTLGTVLGSTVIYSLARIIPTRYVDAAISRYGRWFGISPRKVSKAGVLFDRHSRWAVLLGRFIPGVRTAVSVPAGIRRMPYRSFLLYTFLGSAASCSLLTYLGYTAGERFNEISAVITGLSSFVYLALITVVLALLFWRFRPHQ